MPVIPFAVRFALYVIAFVLLWWVTDHPWWIVSVEAGAMAGTPGLDF